MKSALILCLVLTLASCKKDTSLEGGSPITLMEAVKGNSWKINSLVLTTSDGGFANLFEINFKPCEKDDLLQFNADETFSKSDNTMICTPLGSSVFNDLNGGGWAVSSKDSVLAIFKGFNVQNYKVTKWTANAMTWKQTSKDYLGIENTLTYTLSR